MIAESSAGATLYVHRVVSSVRCRREEVKRDPASCDTLRSMLLLDARGVCKKGDHNGNGPAQVTRSLAVFGRIFVPGNSREKAHKKYVCRKLIESRIM